MQIAFLPIVVQLCFTFLPLISVLYPIKLYLQMDSLIIWTFKIPCPVLLRLFFMSKGECPALLIRIGFLVSYLKYTNMKPTQIFWGVILKKKIRFSRSNSRLQTMLCFRWHSVISHSLDGGCWEEGHFTGKELSDVLLINQVNNFIQILRRGS